MKTEIKAVTYHLLDVVKDDHGWQAQVIFDI
jgi:SHS2 domain-containing protein